MRKDTLIAFGSLFVAASAGGAIGYLVAKKQLKTQYEDLATFEIAQAREWFAAQYKTDPKYASPSTMVEDLGLETETETETEYDETVSEYQGQKVNVVTPDTNLAKPEIVVEKPQVVEQEIIQNNIFVNGQPLNPDEFDMDAELEYRKTNVCYVLSEDEYVTNDEDFEQTTLTYFVHDNVLIDEDEKIIDDVDETVGLVNLERFGHGTDDADTVFIANEARQMAYEVARSEQRYEEDYLGFTPDRLEHSDDQRMRRRHKEWTD